MAPLGHPLVAPLPACTLFFSHSWYTLHLVRISEVRVGSLNILPVRVKVALS